MKTLTRFLVGALFFVSIDAQAGEWTINYCKDLTVDEFHEAAKSAFQKRKYVIVGETANGLSSSYYYVLRSLTGARKGKKVEIAMTTPRHIVIRWVPGFGYEKDNWLKSVKYDVLWGLAGAAQTGAWTINWCKDLTVDEFHRAAKWAFQKRKYIIVGETANGLSSSYYYVLRSLTGAQKRKKVEIAMTAPGHIVIRWVPGFGYEKDNWLKNLWWDVSGRLAE